MSKTVPVAPSVDVSPFVRLPAWADRCTTDFARLDPERTVAVLPVAAIEQHGPHLPLSVDADLLEGILAVAAAHLHPDSPVLALPSQVVGLSTEHERFAGTLSLEPETLIRLWCDMGASVARAGVRKLLIFNTHGGHSGIMEVVGRQLRARHDLLVYSSSWFNLPLLDVNGQDLNLRFSPDEHRFGIHAGEIETAMMRALRPERVQMDRARTFASSSQQRAQRWPILGNGRSAKLAWMMQDYNRQGAVGDAAAATADKGLALVGAAGRALAELLLEIDRLPPDTLREDVAYPARR